MTDSDASAIATPPTELRGLAKLQGDPAVLGLAARAFAVASRWLGKPIRFGDKILVGRHRDVTDVLSRDLEFRIGPVNAAKIEAVNGQFVLGLDRGETLVRERSALYRAVARVDLTAIRAAIEIEAAERLARAGGTIDVVGDYARPIAAETAKRLFGPRPSDAEATLFMDVARAIFAHVFLNIGNDPVIAARAVKAAPKLAGWLQAEIDRRHQSGEHGTDMMGALLADPSLRGENGEPDSLVRRTLGGMLVGSIDTTATCIAKIVTLMGRDAKLAAAIAAAADDPDGFGRLHGWCWEALRRWPHNPIVLRQAAVDTTIAGVPVRAGDQVILATQSAMLDTSVFPDPGTLNPSRPTRPYLHLGGGLHPCAGRDVNAFQIPVLVGALARRGIKSVGAIAWAGPFPDHLMVTFDRMSA